MQRKILILTNNARMMLVFWREMLAALCRTYDIVLACPKNTSTEKDFTDLGIRTRDVPVDRRGMNPVKDALLFVRYLRLLREEHPDAVITFTIKPDIYGAWAAYLLHIPCIVTVEGLGSAWSGKAASFVRRLYATGLKKARLIFVLNDEIYSELKGVGIDPCVMKYLPGMGVNLTYFTPTPYPSDNLPSLLTIGLVMHEKGFPELIRAAHVLKKELPNLVWYVVGAPEERERALLLQLKECPNVVYHGPAKDVRPYYALCHATITTTYHEGMSTVCLEAAASARPILGSRIPSVADTFIEGKTGLGRDVGDSADTVRVIKTFFGLSNQKHSEMGKAGRAFIEKRFDRNKVTWSYFTVLESVYAEDNPEALDAALESIAQSTRLPEAVVLVKDGTLPVALEHAIAKWQGGVLKHLAVGYAHNKGLAYALSYALQFVRTELVARMDSDDICAKDRFERQVASWIVTPRLQLAQGTVKNLNPILVSLSPRDVFP